MRVVGDIGADECRRLLGAAGTGRAIHTLRALPAVTVVDYAVAGGTLHFLAEAGSSFAVSVCDRVIGFHAEHLDRERAEGWSVTVSGAARPVPWPGPAGVREALRGDDSHDGEHLFGLPLAHLSGQLLRRASPGAAPVGDAGA
jgi:hypothetical protein